MSESAIILVGAPDSGKTNFLARLWKALQSSAGVLAAPETPTNIEYVEEALAHLLQGSFAPRSSKNIEESEKSFSISVVAKGTGDTDPIQLVVPDVTGELWKNAVETCELPKKWLENLTSAHGALLFVRIGSNQNVELLNWVTAATLMRMEVLPLDEDQDAGERIPTAVLLCELLRFLEYGLKASKDGVKPRVAILVTAWDRLDADTAAMGPSVYLSNEYPLFAGRLADTSELDVKVFGVSIVGGDFDDKDFRQQFLDGNMNAFGYVVHNISGKQCTEHDVTVPVAWVLEEL